MECDDVDESEMAMKFFGKVVRVCCRGCYGDICHVSTDSLAAWCSECGSLMLHTPKCPSVC